MNDSNFLLNKFRVKPGQKIDLSNYDPNYTNHLEESSSAKVLVEQDIKRIEEHQYLLYAENRHALLIIFQAMDAAGKDSAIRHIMNGVSPQGCEVHSFKHPSMNELGHDYLWRHHAALPDRGRIGIFNRSHYENVLISRVHPELVLAENLPGIESVDELPHDFWQMRFRQINQFEQTVTENGTTIIKFFLHLSKEEQRQRFLKRINREDKNWKFNNADIEERRYWDDYQTAYAEVLSHCSTAQAPWYVVPADNKWFSRVVIGNVIAQTMEQMNLKLPALSEEEVASMEQARISLSTE